AHFCTDHAPHLVCVAHRGNVDKANIPVLAHPHGPKFDLSPTAAQFFLAGVVIEAGAEFFQSYFDVARAFGGRQGFGLPMCKLAENRIGKSQAAAGPNGPVRVMAEKVDANYPVTSRDSMKTQFHRV